MSNTVWSRRTDIDFARWQDRFLNTCTDFTSELGLDVLEVAEIEAITDEFNEAMRNLVAARAAYEAAVVRKDLVRARAVDVDRRYVARFQADSSLSIDTFGRLDVPLRTRRGARGRAKPVERVIASADIYGVATIQYKRGENPESVLFLIQESRNGGPWTTVTSTKRTRIKLKGYPPGEPVVFRVVTLRNETQALSRGYGTIWMRNEKAKPSAAA